MDGLEALCILEHEARELYAKHLGDSTQLDIEALEAWFNTALKDDFWKCLITPTFTDSNASDIDLVERVVDRYWAAQQP